MIRSAWRRGARSTALIATSALVTLPAAAAAGTPVQSPPQWEERTPALSPPARTQANMVYDSHRDRMVLYGGGTSSERFSTDTWAYDGSNWQQISLESSPTERLAEAMAYDPVRDEIVMYGGWNQHELVGTWIFKDDAWASASPPASPHPLQSHMMAWDPNLERVILFGGVHDYESFHNDTWAWDGKTWTQLHPLHSPSARTLGALAYDPSRDALVLFSGYDANAQLLRDTWVWDGEDWTEETTLRKIPPARGSAAVATFGRHLVLFGGLGGSGLTGDLSWLLKKHTWKKLDLDPTPEPRWHPAASWNAKRHEVVLFSGSTAEESFTRDTWSLHR